MVVGSPPPDGRDLDLLVSRRCREEIERALASRGWIVRGGTCARFHDCAADVVELLDGRQLGIPPAVLSSVLDQALPLEGCTRIVLPAPHHLLLILARRVARVRAPLPDKHRRKIDAYLQANPAVWEEAEAEAPAWCAGDALAILRDAYACRSASPARRAAAVAQELRAIGHGSFAAWVRAWMGALPRPSRRRGFIVALSGLDGAGKSTQAQALREALRRLGYDAEARWSSLLHYPGSLQLLRRSVDQVLIAIRPAGAGPREVSVSAPMPTHGGVPPLDTAAKRLRQQSQVVATAWIALVAARNGLEHRRIARPHLSRGRVVICDRYVLDSLVQLRYQYGGGHSVGIQCRLVRLLSPRPDRAFFLDVSPETASGRKADYSEEENLLRARLYDEECNRLGVRRLDGQRDRVEICAEMAAEVWAALCEDF